MKSEKKIKETLKKLEKKFDKSINKTSFKNTDLLVLALDGQSIDVLKRVLK